MKCAYFLICIFIIRRKQHWNKDNAKNNRHYYNYARDNSNNQTFTRLFSITSDYWRISYRLSTCRLRIYYGLSRRTYCRLCRRINHWLRHGLVNYWCRRLWCWRRIKIWLWTKWIFVLLHTSPIFFYLNFTIRINRSRCGISHAHF